MQHIAGTDHFDNPVHAARVWILDRKSLQVLDSFGRPGVAPGEFYVLHHMNVDSKGNLYVTEVQGGKRAQKFVYKDTVMKQVVTPGRSSSP